MPTDTTEIDPDAGENTPPTPFTDATEAYLEAAPWLASPLCAPFVIQARQIARMIDRQLDEGAKAALLAQYDKALVRLEARRPPEATAPTDPAADAADGTASIFGLLED